jgi:hypothetical protein|nr:MAG TPA: hypothetical protein [Caudoviricetes sp.]
MEKSSEEWKGFVIVYSNKLYRVKNFKKYFEDSFTTLARAKDFIDKKLYNEQLKEDAKNYRDTLAEIKKEPDINKRTRMYKKLCQANQK